MNSPWPIVRLGDYLEFVTSGSRGWSEYVRETGSRFIRIQNVGRNELILDDIAYVQPPPGAEAERTLVQSGDVLLSITADLGRTAVIPDGFGPAHINQHLVLMRLRDFDPHFVSAFIGLGPGRKQLLKLDRGGVKSGLNFDDIRSINLPLAPLSEQQQVVAILDKADAIRRMRRESVRIAEELLRSTFLEMFGDPVTNPKSWPTVRLGELLNLRPQIGTIQPASEIGDQLCVRVGEIGGRQIDFANVKKVTLSQDELEKFRLKAGDLVLARAIGSESHIGKASLFTGYTRDVVFDSHVMRIRLNPNLVQPEWLRVCLLTPGGRSLFLKKSRRTSVQFNINAEQISELELPLPPVGLQRAYVNISNQNQRLVEELVTAQNITDQTFATLLHRAFRGELTPSESAPRQLSIFGVESKHS